MKKGSDTPLFCCYLVTVCNRPTRQTHIYGSYHLKSLFNKCKKENFMKKIGILGGAGPVGTADIYLRIHDRCVKYSSVTRPNIIIESMPISFANEQQALAGNINKPYFLNLLKKSSQSLEKAGAEVIILPCNTLHCLFQDLKPELSIPSLSIVESVARFLSTQNVKKVGVLATNTTINQNLYGDEFDRVNISVCYPPKALQAQLDEIIFKQVMTPNMQSDQSKILEIESICEQLFQQGCDYIVIACTDLPSINRSNVINAIDTHVDAIFELASLQEAS